MQQLATINHALNNVKVYTLTFSSPKGMVPAGMGCGTTITP